MEENKPYNVVGERHQNNVCQAGIGMKEYVEMISRLSRLEKFEVELKDQIKEDKGQLRQQLEDRDEVVDSELKSLRADMSEQNEKTNALIKSEVESVRADINKSIEKLENSSHETLKSIEGKIEKIEEIGNRLYGAFKAVSAIGGFIAAVWAGLSQLIEHKELAYSFFRFFNI